MKHPKGGAWAPGCIIRLRMGLNLHKLIMTASPDTIISSEKDIELRLSSPLEPGAQTITYLRAESI